MTTPNKYTKLMFGEERKQQMNTIKDFDEKVVSDLLLQADANFNKIFKARDFTDLEKYTAYATSWVACLHKIGIIDSDEFAKELEYINQAYYSMYDILANK